MNQMPAWMQQLNGMQLTPEQLAQLGQRFAGTQGAVNRDGFDIGSAIQQGWGDNAGAAAGQDTLLGYTAVPTGTDWNNISNDDWYGSFDPTGKFEGARHPHEFDMGDAAPFLMAIAAGAAAFAPAAGAAGAAGGTGATGTGAGMVAGDAFLPGALGAGYEGAALTGLDAYLAGGAGGAMGGAAGAGAGGGAGGGAGSGFTFNAAVDSQLANSALGLGSVGGATAPAIASGAGGGGGLLSGLGSMGGKDLLGLGATALGALSGAQGQESENSTTRDIPSWLKPYVQKNLGYASGLLDRQMAPGAMPGYEAMRNAGMGLLGTPQQGNGFNRFFPGR